MLKKVYLVGAGAGDVGLLTLKAKRLLECADVVVYDRLADDKILSYVADEAEKIYVGKSSGQHTMKQSDINQLLVNKANENKMVVRLKGGDPFVFGRGGEEALTLFENNIDFEIVPGVTSAIAVPAYAGIPVTHRGIATSFAVITGHEMSEESNIRWNKLSTGVDTLIFLMGIANLPTITQRLIDNGRASDTPAAVIQWGTKSKQRVLITTVAKAAEDVTRNKITPPAIFIVGDVVTLRDKLQWFDNPKIKPLFGKTIVVTRARAQASKLTNMLTELGANCIECPMIKIVPPSDNYKAVDAAIDVIDSYDYIIFTSANGVSHFFDRLNYKQLDSRSLYKSKIVVIGTATSAELAKHGISADFMPTEFKAEAVVD
ncbi:MAG: uroporphyrinogen-III C-methyltransferase, partial [Selenomonadaceae bacterium]|nr:uroporphyrinogen-III C-methyltransferase [Selenomonadaceae bacterium]